MQRVNVEPQKKNRTEGKVYDMPREISFAEMYHRATLEEIKDDRSEEARQARYRIHALIADIRETEKKAKERAKRQTRRR